MSLLDTLQSIGGAIGTLGSGVATYLATQIRVVREGAKAAIDAAARAEIAYRNAQAEAASLRSEMDALRRGVRLELESFRQQEAPTGRHNLLAQDVQPELVRRLDELARRIEEVRSEITRERGARHTMQQRLNDEAREEERQWREIIRDLGEIKGELSALRAVQR